MIELEIINELNKQVSQQGYTFSYYDDLEKFFQDKNSNYKLMLSKRGYSFFELRNVHKTVPQIIKKLNYSVSISLNECSCDLAWISELKEVSSLTLLFTSYKNLPDEFTKLKTIKHLTLMNSGLHYLPAVVREFSSLTTIRIMNDGSGEGNPFLLPNWLSKMPNLESINLETAYVHSIPADLVKTKMEFILENDSSKKGIHLFGTKLFEGDISLFGQPRNVIEAFYFGRQESQRECKVIFLGEGKSGKSSLIERLISNTYKEGKLPTEGIRMQTWPVEIDGETIRLRILDFGGQEIMHAMHRCFMTQHTVYVLVCDSRQDGDLDREAARWLETIQSFAPGCPVILALNKADENKNVSVNETNLRAINPNLRKPIETSAKWEQARGTAKLLDEIKNAVNLAMDKSKGNTDILRLREHLETMDKDYITAQEYKILCDRCNVGEEDIQENLLEWFKELGICYYYKSSALNTRLEGLRVLNPAWLTNGIYRLILRTPPNGILSHTLIKSVLKATDPNDIMPHKTYAPEETEFILYVMRKFEISISIGDGKELIPLKMSKAIPETVNNFNRKTALHLSWKASYIPNTVVHRLIIRKYSELDINCLWRFGARFDSRDKKQSALVYMSETRIDVFVQGQDKRQYMEEFRKEIIGILNDLNLKPEETIHFIWEGAEREAPYFEVLEQYKRGRGDMYVRGAQRYPNPAKILQEHYVEEKNRMDSISSSNMSSAGDNSPVVNGETVVINYGEGDNEVKIHKSKRISITPNLLSESIMSRDAIEQSEFDDLVTHLRKISKRREIPLGLRLKMNRIIKQCENRTATSSWQKLRDFLGDAANLATIISLAIAPEFIKLLQTIFT